MTKTGDAYLDGLDAMASDYLALKELNTRLLMALVLMEGWCSLLALNFASELGDEIKRDGALTRDLAVAHGTITLARKA